MNKIETIREACIKANPSIKDLVFGCVVVNEVGEQERVLWSIDSWKKGGKDVQLDGTAVHIHESELKEIIGRPIRLADVLLAIEKKYKDKYRVTSQGVFENYNPLLQRHVVNETWNLLKDDLTQQSDETIDFLFELLK